MYYVYIEGDILTNWFVILHFTFYIYIYIHFTDCEWKAQAGSVCVASFDWSCSGICKSAERMKGVHSACGEGDRAVWNVAL